MEKKNIDFYKFFYQKEEELNFCNEKKIYISSYIMWWQSTRLKVLGKKLPKTLVKVNNKPIIWYIIKFLEKIHLIIYIARGLQRQND